jgi:hypothetical protein
MPQFQRLVANVTTTFLTICVQIYNINFLNQHTSTLKMEAVCSSETLVYTYNYTVSQLRRPESEWLALLLLLLNTKALGNGFYAVVCKIAQTIQQLGYPWMIGEPGSDCWKEEDLISSP